MKKLTFFFLVFAHIHLSAQDMKLIDSLKSVLDQNLSNKKRANTHNLIAQAARETDSALVAFHVNEALKIARANDLWEEIADAYHQIAYATLEKGYHAIADSLYNIELKTSLENEYVSGEASAYLGLGLVRSRQSEFDKSNQYYDKALTIYRRLEDSGNIASCLTNMAINSFYSGKPNEALVQFKEILKIREEQGDLSRIRVALNNLGSVFGATGKYDSAAYYLERTLKISEELNDVEAMSTTYQNLGVLRMDLGEYNLALDYYLQALAIDEKLGSPADIASTYNNIAILFDKQKYNEKALEYYTKALEIHRQLKDSTQIAINLNNLGTISEKLSDYQNALEKYTESLTINEKIGDQVGKSFSLQNLGSLALKMNETDKAINYLDQALVIRKAVNPQSRDVGNTMVFLGEAYFKKNDLKTAESYLGGGLAIARDQKILPLERDALETLYQVYQKTGNPGKALDAHVRFKQLSDSLLNEENIIRISKMESEYQAEKREEILKAEQAIKEQELQAKNQRNLLIASVIGLFLLMVGAFIYYQYRQRNRYARVVEEKNQQLSETMASKERLFSIIAHDLKSPLSAFSSISSTLADNIESFQKEQIVDYLRKFEKSSENLEELLNNLLQWSLSQTGSLQVNPEKINLKSAMENAIKPLTDFAESKRINLTIDSEDLGAEADAKMVETVLRNLVSNALKFTPEGGQVSLSAKSENGQVVVAIRDSGIGMTEDQKQKLFDMKEDPSRIGDHEAKGTGLGLILSRELVEKNKGKIWVETKPEKGSTFYFSLPTAA